MQTSKRRKKPLAHREYLAAGIVLVCLACALIAGLHGEHLVGVLLGAIGVAARLTAAPELKPHVDTEPALSLPSSEDSSRAPTHPQARRQSRA
jgi:hypothetical protein